MPASQAKPSKQTRKAGASGVTHVAIIGAGRGGKALMEIFANDPLVDIVAVAEIDDLAPGIALAKRLKIPVTQDYRMLLNLERVDLIIDVSGSVEVWQSLQDFHRMGVTILGGASAKFMWELIEARIRATAEIEKTLNKYQSLYRLYVKETGAAVTEERTRIACEIHDGLVQSLAGVGFKLETGLTDRRLLAHAGQHVLQRAAVRCVVEHIAGGDKRRGAAPPQNFSEPMGRFQSLAREREKALHAHPAARMG